MHHLDQIWTILIGDKYSPVHDVTGPRPMSRDQKQKKCILTKWLKLFSRIFSTITIQKPFWRNLSMRFGLWWKIKKWECKMCFFDRSFEHNFFVFHFVAKPMFQFRENMMFFRIVLKSSNYNSPSKRKVLLRGTGSGDRIFSGLVPKHCWPGCYGNLHSLFGVTVWLRNNFAILRIVDSSGAVIQIVAAVRLKPSNWMGNEDLSPGRAASVLASCTLQSAIFFTNAPVLQSIQQ